MNELNEFTMPFIISRKSPPLGELHALWDWLTTIANGRGGQVLEFGCGCTTWVLQQTLSPANLVCVETFPRCIEPVRQHIPQATIVGSWDQIPRVPYNFMLVDSSTGAPSNLPSLVSQSFPFRDDAIAYALEFCCRNVVIVHDWCHRQLAFHAPKRYLESSGFQLLWSHTGRRGFGAYQRASQ